MKSLLKKFTEKYLIPIVQKKFFDHPGTKELFNTPEKLFYDQWGYAKTTKIIMKKSEYISSFSI